MVILLMDYGVMDIIKLNIYCLHVYRIYLIVMLMELMAYELINNNLHIKKQRFSFRWLILINLQFNKIVI